MSAVLIQVARFAVGAEFILSTCCTCHVRPQVIKSKHSSRKDAKKLMPRGSATGLKVVGVPTLATPLKQSRDPSSELPVAAGAANEIQGMIMITSEADLLRPRRASAWAARRPGRHKCLCLGTTIQASWSFCFSFQGFKDTDCTMVLVFGVAAWCRGVDSS